MINRAARRKELSKARSLLRTLDGEINKFKLDAKNDIDTEDKLISQAYVDFYDTVKATKTDEMLVSAYSNLKLLVKGKIGYKVP